MSNNFTVYVSEGWDTEVDKPNWCVEIFEEGEGYCFSWAKSTNSIADAAYDAFQILQREKVIK